MQIKNYPANEVAEFINELYREVDNKQNANGFANYFQEDGLLRFGNQEPVQGQDEITGAIQNLFDILEDVEHTVFEVYTKNGDRVDENTIIMESTVYYERLEDGKEIETPATTALEVQEGEIHECRIYVDLTPLYQ